MFMYFGDLKKEALSFIYLGDSIVVVSPVFRAFQVPVAGEPRVAEASLFPLSPYFEEAT